MAIRLVTYKSVRNRVRDALGIDSTDLDVDTAARIRSFINKRVRMAWEHYPWPEICRIEARTFQQAYASGSTYTAGDKVYYPRDGKYYEAVKAVIAGQEPLNTDETNNYAYWYPCSQTLTADDYAAATAYVAGDLVYYYPTDTFYACHTASTGNVPTNTSYWGPVTPFDRTINRTQSWESNEIGDMVGIWNAHPLRNTAAVPIGWRMVGEDFHVDACDKEGLTAPGKVYVKFRDPFQSYTGDEYDSAAAYSAGDTVYYDTTGDYYKALQSTTGNAPTDTTYWEKIRMPYLFGEYAAQSVYSDVMGKVDGQTARQTIEASEGYEILIQQIDIIERQQGQEAPVEFATR